MDQHALLWFLGSTSTVMELWSDGPRVTFPEPRVASFDLSLSWAANGLALLALGLLCTQRDPG